MKRKIDERVKNMIENCILSNHRSIFFIIGNNGKDQIPMLHHIYQKFSKKELQPVLWMNKKDLEFASQRKQMKMLQKKIKSGQMDFDDVDPFELFMASVVVSHCSYNDSNRILGQTFSMCVLQNFEAITPNILARSIETVCGGGLIIFLFKTIESMRLIYKMEMDTHSRFRTESHNKIVPRFNERFVLSLAKCQNCLVVDDQLKILPISFDTALVQSSLAKSRKLESVECSGVRSDSELEDLKRAMSSDDATRSAGLLVGCCATVDQAKAVLKFVEVILEKSRSIVVLTAARGRGKSAALGLGISSAIDHGYTKVMVTSPTPENLDAVFGFICKGLNAQMYQEGVHYSLVRSTNPDFNKAIVKINIFKNHRQTVQYLPPSEVQLLGQADLLCIDEAAAIPLPIVKKLLDSGLVFMSSTINGYEGTGRSLSLKLINDIRQKAGTCRGTSVDIKHVKESFRKKINQTPLALIESSLFLHEMTLTDCVRYGNEDPVENWLYDLLCLNVSDIERVSSVCPPASSCRLYYVNRDTLFSGHKQAEDMLKRLVSVYVSSHYKNTPNDLQMLADAPAHHIFCLLGPITSEESAPEVLCVLQVALEGNISKESVSRCQRRGERATGDLIPWTIDQQFSDQDFATKSGLRIVRIATHPDFQGLGYGKRTLEMLQEYYEGRISFSPLPEDSTNQEIPKQPMGNLHEEYPEPRDRLCPLLISLNHRKPEVIDYIGVSYGITSDLFRFWKRFGMTTLYIRQTANNLTGEHTCIMLKKVVHKDSESENEDDWITTMWTDFHKRFLHLLPFDFRSWRASLALDVILRPSSKINVSTKETTDLSFLSFTASDLRRLEQYCDNQVDYRLIKDLVYPLTMFYFLEQHNIRLNAIKSAILLGMGLQGKSVDEVIQDLDTKGQGLSAGQVLSFFNQSIKTLMQFIRTKNSRTSEETHEKKSTTSLPKSFESAKKNKRKFDENDDLDSKKLKK